jgi:nucleotide-binding universal stress UspA family protein
MDLRQVVVAVDGSPACAESLEYAIWLVRQGGTALTGLFILDTGWADFIGNDWQSSSGARQGFLDHVGREQGSQAECARRQFVAAVAGLSEARFSVVAGDPIPVLLQVLDDPATGLLVFGRRTFQVGGRPSLRSAARELARRGTGPLLLLP